MMRFFALAAILAGAASSDPIEGGRFRLKSNTSVCLTDSLGFAACDDAQSQSWEYYEYYFSVPSLEECLEAGNGHLAMAICIGEPSQQWTLTSEGQLQAHVSGCEQLGAQVDGCCMEAKDDTVTLRSCDNTNPNQIWTFDSDY